jgi:hypothetical protein
MRHISGIIAAEEKGKLARGNKVRIMIHENGQIIYW